MTHSLRITCGGVTLDVETLNTPTAAATATRSRSN